MFTSLENRLWLAVHLLYPNSSQAFDVYEAVALHSEEILLKNNQISIFKKLILLFEKIPSVSSNLSFYEFEFEQIDQWKIIYKSSQKSQLLIFIGVLIFDLKIGEIAACINLSKEKAQFLFHQIFKKISQSGTKAKINEQLSFKKENDLKISYLYTYENLVEYCLGQLSEEETAKVKMGIDLYPALQTTKDEYQKIINQIQNLKVQRSNSVEPRAKNKITLVKDLDLKNPQPTDPPFFSNVKKMAAVFSLTAMAVTFLQVTGVFTAILNSEKSVVMRQVVKKPEFVSPQPDRAVESLPKPSEILSSDKTNPQKHIATSATDHKKSTTEKPIAKVVVKDTAAKDEGGLFRGTLVVKDLNSSNEKLMAKMSLIGAKKAGEVELGWLKSNNLAYYHFIISDKNLDETRDYLKELGNLKMRFESHPRLVPAGNKRFIIEVKGN